MPRELVSLTLMNALQFTYSNDGLPLLEVRTGSLHAKFALQGAHLIEFNTSTGHSLLFVSKKSLFKKGSAIRGGIPVIFPWFGPREGHPESPMHGLVRTRPWELQKVEFRNQSSVLVSFAFSDTEETRALWPYPFRLELDFELGESLQISWRVINTGESPFTFEQALHPYFPIKDVHTACVKGLQGVSYIDKTDGLKIKTDTAPAISFTTETDRLYLDTETDCILEAGGDGGSLRLGKTGSHSTVVWNPWIAKAKALADMADEEWQAFVCVEQVNANRNAITLASGKTHLFQAFYVPAP